MLANVGRGRHFDVGLGGANKNALLGLITRAPARGIRKTWRRGARTSAPLKR